MYCVWSDGCWRHLTQLHISSQISTLHRQLSPDIALEDQRRTSWTTTFNQIWSIWKNDGSAEKLKISQQKYFYFVRVFFWSIAMVTTPLCVSPRCAHLLNPSCWWCHTMCLVLRCLCDTTERTLHIVIIMIISSCVCIQMRESLYSIRVKLTFHFEII